MRGRADLRPEILLLIAGLVAVGAAMKLTGPLRRRPIS
jgi:hypothetical protein